MFTFCKNLTCKKLGGKICSMFRATILKDGVVFCECGCSQAGHDCKARSSQFDALVERNGQSSTSNNESEPSGGMLFSQIPNGVRYAQLAAAKTAKSEKEPPPSKKGDKTVVKPKSNAEFNMFADVSMKKEVSESPCKAGAKRSSKRSRSDSSDDDGISSKKKKAKKTVILTIDSDDEFKEEEVTVTASKQDTSQSSQSFASTSSTSTEPPPLRVYQGQQALRAEVVPSRAPAVNHGTVVVVITPGDERGPMWEVPRSAEEAIADAHREGAPDHCVGTDVDPPAAHLLVDLDGQIVPVRDLFLPGRELMLFQSRYCWCCMRNHASGDKAACKKCKRWVFRGCSGFPDYIGPELDMSTSSRICCACKLVNKRNTKIDDDRFVDLDLHFE